MGLRAKLPRINLRLCFAALAAIGILHIIATLAAPRLAPLNGYDRLAKGLPLNTMQVLPPIAPGTQKLPFFSPDARYALCRFDTADGAVSLTATLPGPGWVLALYSTEGDNFFTSVAQPGRSTSVSLLLVPGEERLAETPAKSGTSEDATLKVIAREGIALVRAPDQGEAYSARNAAELKRARCAHRTL